MINEINGENGGYVRILKVGSYDRIEFKLPDTTNEFGGAIEGWADPEEGFTIKIGLTELHVNRNGIVLRGPTVVEELV